MFIARWRIDAKFGQKQKVVEMLRQWSRDIAPQAGWATSKGQMLTGSVGALEATVEHNWSIESLAELEQVWAKLGTLDAHAKWGRELEPFVVSGSSRWEVFRVL
jgi:hypothetical protein